MKQRRSMQETSTAVTTSRSTIVLPRKVLARYVLATVGSRTSLGGEVIAAAGGRYGGEYRLACVGDVVRYADGSESVITSGAGHASTFGDMPVALVGSHVANGDRIVASPHNLGEIVQFEGEAPIPGLLQPGFVAPVAPGDTKGANDDN